MLKIIVYSAMNSIFSSRDIETACRRDINFMFLLEGMSAPEKRLKKTKIVLAFSIMEC